MKDFNLVKRILIGFVIYFVVIISFYIIVDKKIERRYKYMTQTYEWGISNYCYMNKNQNLFCKIDGVLKPVQQFYEEESYPYTQIYSNLP